MTNIKALFGLRGAVLAAVGIMAMGAAQASASSAPIVITYEKTCIDAVGTCAGTTGNGDTLTMGVTDFRATGKAGGAQLALTEEIKSAAGTVTFAAVMKGHRSPADFIVLNGTVTSGPFVGAHVHQRSNLVVQNTDGTSEWEGELWIMPASA